MKMSDTVVFSGGTAFKETARELAKRNTVVSYIITTFDSGGSSQALRQVFDMPAVGDLRNRLLAVARDQTAANALNVRLSEDECLARQSLHTLFRYLAGVDPNIKQEIEADLKVFLASVPDYFCAARASLGNLALTGAWLQCGSLVTAVNRYTELLGCIGTIIPISEDNLHLAAKLVTGETVLYQHLFASAAASLQDIHLVNGNGHIVTAQATSQALAAIGKAKFVIYPMGSFYSSILPNLLLDGVPKHLEDSESLKIFIPNVGKDKELHGLPVLEQIKTILRKLSGQSEKSGNFLHLVLVDKEAHYPGGLPSNLEADLARMGVRLVSNTLVSGACGENYHNPTLVADALEKIVAHD